jgi:hypothetical protein
MANWFPLIVNTGSNQIQELPSGQNLDLTGSNISNVAAITINSSGGTSIINGGSNGTGNIGSNSSYFNIVFAQSTSAQYADLAEKYQSDQDYPPGTVVVFGIDTEITISTTEADTRVAGVVTTAPAYIMNAGLVDGVAVALVGRVPCQVVGTIRRGDLLSTSHIPGVATRANDPVMGTVIGKALANYNSSVPGMIEVVVGRL